MSPGVLTTAYPQQAANTSATGYAAALYRHQSMAQPSPYQQIVSWQHNQSIVFAERRPTFWRRA